MAALNANDFYAQMRMEAGASGLYRPVSATPAEAEAVKASARFGIGPLFQAESNFASALSLVSGSLSRHVQGASRRTIAQNVRRDPASPTYARVPQGPTTCPWCLILASRGDVYGSKEDAGDKGGPHNHYHDHCNCQAIPVFSQEQFSTVKATYNYDPDALYDQYRQVHGARMDLQDTANAWANKFGV